MPTDLQEIAMALHAVLGAIRDTAPKPGPHVVGGPPPKPGERTEADYLREEVREVRAMAKKLFEITDSHATQLENVWQEIAALRPKCPCCVDDCNGGPAPEAAPPSGEEAADMIGLKAKLTTLEDNIRRLRRDLSYAVRGEPDPDALLGNLVADAAENRRDIIALRAALKAEQAAHAETCDLLNELSAVRSADLAEARATARREAIEEAEAAIEGWWRKAMVLKLQHLHDAQAAIRALAPVAQKGGEDATGQ